MLNIVCITKRISNNKHAILEKQNIAKKGDPIWKEN